MKTMTVSKRFVALLCCIAVCVALMATALGFNLASRAQAEDAQENEIALLSEEEPTGDTQIIEEEITTPSEDITGEEASQAGEVAVAEETQTPAEEPASGEPDETTVPDDFTESEGSTESENPAVPDDAAEPENPIESEGLPEESGEPDEAEPAGSEESAEPDLTGTEATGETVDAAEPEPDDTDAIDEEAEPEDIDADAENADAEDADAEEEATSEDDYGIMLLADTVDGGTFGAEGDNLNWKLDDEYVLTISGSGAMEDWSIVGSEPWYSYSPYITSVIIDEGVTYIGEGAFENCESLESVELPTSLDSIGDYAFFDCTSLTSISIPYGITSIDEGTFNYCINLKSVELPSTLTNIGDNAFFECYALADISIPAGVTSIGLGAFAYCESIESLELPNILTSIGNWAFYDCISLTGISIPAGITSIGEGTFEYCENLASVELPSNLTSIGDGAFRRCYALTDILIPYGVTSIGYAAFADCTSLTSVELPSTLTSIDNYAFQNCPLNGDSMIDTTTVNAGAEVYSIDSEGTTWTTQTTSYTGHTLTLPESVTSVGRYAFDNTSVDYFVIGSSLTSITGNAFASNSLEAIIFDNSKDQVTVENDNYASIAANNPDGDVSLIYLDGGNGFELSLTKEVIGYSGPNTFEFEITLTQQDGTPFSGELDADGTEEMVSFTDGNATVEIGSGETLTLLWIPENMQWSIVEATPADGTAISVNGSEAADAEGILTEDTAVTFTNYYKTEITVSIVWDDADNQDGLRPDSVLVQLLVDEDPYSDPVELNADNGWSITWSDLDTYADGHEIGYVVEVEESDGYEMDGDWIKNGDGTYSLVITNTHTPKGETPAPTMSADVGDGTEVNPGESITYTIGYTNGSEDGATITITDVLDEGLDFVSATDGGTYDEATRTITWVITDVPANAEGSISFTVVVNESALSNGEVSNSAMVQINDELAVTTNTVTNPVKVVSTVTFEVVKVWDDNNDLYGERPELIVVVLLENGKATMLSQLLSAENSWTGTFSDLPEYDENGEKIVYSIAEVTVPNYTSVITGDQESGFTVTNTYDFDEITNPDSGNPNTGTPNTGNPQSGNPEPGIPQTGQDSLPIAPIAVSGAAIVAAGVALLAVRRRRAA